MTNQISLTTLSALGIFLSTFFSEGVTTAQVQLNDDGCRQLSKLPPPGVHPRVLFTSEELPLIKQRPIASINSVEPAFRVMLFPHQQGEALPTTTWDEDRRELTVDVGSGQQKLWFQSDDKNGTRIATK